MNINDIIPLISAIFVFILSLIVLLKNKKSPVNFTFFLHGLSITIWLFGTFMMFISQEDREMAIFWDRIVYSGVVFIPVFMYHFGLAFRNKKKDALLYIGYFLSIFFLILSRTKYFVDDVFEYKWGIHTQARLFHHLFLIYFTAYVGIWFFQILRYYKTIISPLKKEQTRYIAFGFLILFTIGPLAYLPAYGIGIYPFAYISGVIFAVFLAYAIIVHRLMDIKFVLRKSSVNAVSVITIIVLAILARYAFSIISKDYLVWGDSFILIAGIMVYPLLKNYYFNFANKHFFSSLYDDRALIAELSDHLRMTLNTKEIYNRLHLSLKNAFHFKSFAILSSNKNGNKFILEYNQGFTTNGNNFFDRNPYLENFYFPENKPLVTEEARALINESRTEDTLNMLENLQAEVLAPLNIKKKTVGLIVLGPKESKEIYSKEDLRVLETISAQAAIAIENAALYEETLHFGEKLKTEVESATKQLKEANKKLKQLDQAKSEFISVASHQLRTPLTIIKGYASMIVQGDFGKIPSRGSEAIQKIFVSNERLIALVENLLDISRIESGKQEFKFEKIHLNEIVKSVFEDLKLKAKEKNLSFSLKIPQKTSFVMADKMKIREVIMNLVDNAIKYTDKGSVTVSLKTKNQKIIFAVSDTGIGVKPNDMPNLFKKFSRGTGSFLINTAGTGLGLYVAKKIAEVHRGRAWAESQGEGKGSIFYLELPILNEKNKTKSKK